MPRRDEWVVRAAQRLEEKPARQVLVCSACGSICTSLASARQLQPEARVAGMASVIWAAFAGLFLVAAVIDGRTYRIPNWIPLALTALFVVAVLTSGQPFAGYWPHLAASAGMLALGYLLYALTGMGAGDAKLAAAAMLWAGLVGLYAWVFALALAMAALAIGLIVVRTVAATAGHAPQLRMFQRGAPVPLGIALAAATIIASWRFEPALWAF